MDSISLSRSISKIDEKEAMSLTYASLKEAADRKEDSITTERLEKDNTILETYTIISDPISGGMGSVWQVHHEGWNMDLAMKRPRPKYFAEGGVERKKNFLRECENWIRLGLHPNNCVLLLCQRDQRRSVRLFGVDGRRKSQGQDPGRVPLRRHVRRGAGADPGHCDPGGAGTPVFPLE